MNKGLGSGKGLEKGKQKMNILTFLSDEEWCSSDDIIDFLKKLTNIKTNAGVYKHLQELVKDTLIEEKKGNYGIKFYRIKGDVVTFKKVAKKLYEFEESNKFLNCKYFNENFEKYFSGLLKDKNLGEDEYNLVLNIFKTSPTAFRLLLYKGTFDKLKDLKLNIYSQNLSKENKFILNSHNLLAKYFKEYEKFKLPPSFMIFLFCCKYIDSTISIKESKFENKDHFIVEYPSHSHTHKIRKNGTIKSIEF